MCVPLVYKHPETIWIACSEFTNQLLQEYEVEVFVLDSKGLRYALFSDSRVL